MTNPKPKPVRRWLVTFYGDDLWWGHEPVCYVRAQTEEEALAAGRRVAARSCLRYDSLTAQVSA